MKQFFKFMFASMLGVMLSGILLMFILFGIIGSAISSAGKADEVSIEDGSVLHININSPIHERTAKNPFENFNLNEWKGDNSIGLNDIIANLKKAKLDDRIKGVYIDIEAIPAGVATIEEVRNALIDFKQSKKFIIAYSENYSQTAYYLSSVADEIYLNPVGGLDFRGIRAEIMFYKGALEKLEVEPEIIRHGKFKSAIEPYILDKMSDANRKQVSTFMGSIWKYLLRQIAASRHIPEQELQHMANQYLVQNADDALKYKMVDKLVYKDELIDILKKKTGQSKIRLVTIGKYSDVTVANNEPVAKDRIAVIYCEGSIESGAGGEQTIGSETISEAIRKARMDVNVKAIVLRVNSPGGSALASDVIWREVLLANKQKPVVASMGDVAASGGYYIACAANKIYAQPNTITGSIGVFGLMFNAQKLLNNKLGITIDTCKTAAYADMGTVYRPLTASERDIMQRNVEQTYDKFISRVADGRKMTKSNVDSIGQGRVWSAIDAQKIGLVDELGGIGEAIKEAAKLAKLSSYRIMSMPQQKEPLEELFKNITGEVKSQLVKQEVVGEYRIYSELQQLLKIKGLQARMPFSIDIH